MPGLTLIDFTVAACKGMDTRLFVGSSTTARAKNVCAGCPITDDCYEWALADPTLHGVWGATTKTERDAERHRRHTCGRCGNPLPNHASDTGLCGDCRPADHTKPAKLCDQCSQPLEGKERHGKRHAACACGTTSGKTAHLKRGEPVCQKCSDIEAGRLRRVHCTGSGAVAS